ncbi:hypothetical protein [Mycobacteroides abscessus]|uniref:hypothetical protein n=1 Tax=Mycobacteroides abscessus TaxID=36809 RepID=UPI00025882AC|nr:hypothetical protein [Mycobacteroides abscessus]EIC62269.1 hypothetical protein S7W_24091 [Mycobacteroides abscessus M94]SKZ50883.1 Uncharacterised protein [Mycobacteroides abscessus subsp. abscessus]
MSPYHGISQTLAGLAEQVNDSISAVSTPFPGKGTTVDAATDKREAMAAHLGALADWLQTASSTASAQAEFDKGLEAAPSPEDITDLREACYASGNAKEDVDALRDAMEEKEAAQDLHNSDTAGTEWGDQPAAPAGCPTPSTEDPNGDDGNGTGDGLGDLGGDRTEDPDVEGAEDTPVTMTDPVERAPVTMSTGSEPEAPVTMSTGEPISDTNVGTETSADTLTPTAGAGTGQLTQPTQATPGGQPMQGTHGAPNAAFGASGGAPGQLSQPQSTRNGTPQSPEKKREAQDRRDERDATLDAGTGVAGTAAAGILGAGITSSPTTNTSGAQGVTPSQGTPPPTNTPPAGGGVMGGAGGVRPPNGAMGSGENVTHMKRPVILRSEEELNRELDELLGIRVPDDSNEEPKR